MEQPSRGVDGHTDGRTNDSFPATFLDIETLISKHSDIRFFFKWLEPWFKLMSFLLYNVTLSFIEALCMNSIIHW